MAINITHLVLLAVFSGLAMNLILHFGIGLKGIAFDTAIDSGNLLAGCGIHFVSIMLLWLFFLFIRSVLFLGLMEYVILFPLSALLFSCLEYITYRFIFKGKHRFEYGDSLTGGSFTGAVLTGAALFMMLNIAETAPEAVALALGFSGSTALVFIIVSEIRRRSKMEAVPHLLRGGPLALIAMGLLSLVFSSAALMLFEALGG